MLECITLHHIGAVDKRIPNVTDINASAPIEVLPMYINFGLIDTAGMEGRVDWVKQHWEKALDLMESSVEFKLAMDVYLTSQFIQNSAMVMVAVWGALEAFFSFEKSELRFRVSSNLAAYMVPRGPDRTAQQKRVAKLYDARSAAAHGGNRSTAHKSCTIRTCCFAVCSFA